MEVMWAMGNQNVIYTLPDTWVPTGLDEKKAKSVNFILIIENP